MKRALILVGAIVLLTPAGGPRAQQPRTAAAVALVPTSHPYLPRDISQLWLVPENRRTNRPAALSDFASAVKLEADGDFAGALPLLLQLHVRQGPLGQYAEYYKGVAELRLGRAEEARRTFQALQARDVAGYLSEAAALAEAECHEALGDHAAAIEIYDRLSNTKTTTPLDDILMRMGRAARAAGDAEKANRAFARVYYDFPLGDYSDSAGAELEEAPITPGSERYRRQLARAERLFTAKRYERARDEFEDLRRAAQDEDRQLVDLRLAECDYFLKRPRSARTQLRPHLDNPARRGEVLYFSAISARALGDADEYRKTVRHLVDEHTTETWAEDALNDLASYELIQDDNDKADEAFREMYERFPTGRHAQRAAWKIGWWAYRNDRFAETTRVFEKAVSSFPRSDYRPAWLYWSGRAHEALNNDSLADARFRLTAADYLNSYYGRLAAKRLTGRALGPPTSGPVTDLAVPSGADPGERPATQALVPVSPPNSAVVRALLEVELYDQALDELRHAQKAWGDSSMIQATMAWIYLRQGQFETGSRQFTLLRGAIGAMKRAYPQFMAAGGEALPRDVLKIIFPLAYWDLIRKYASQYDLDPHLVAALIAQESTFVPDIKSSANAVGLTQLLPSTARQYARTLKVRYSSRLLTNPETNVRIGLLYLADKIKEFGELHLALASYNAGERAVHRWMTERPGLAQEEFIDDIPFPQTQNYVKKILGTAEDYRRLYGSEAADAAAAVAESPSTTGAATTAPKKSSVKSAKKKKARAAA